MTAPLPERARADAGAILRAAIAAADAAPLTTAALTRAPELGDRSRIHLVAVGKAAASMAGAALDVLHPRVGAALVIVPRGTSMPPSRRHGRARVLHASHPLPDSASLAAGLAIERLLAASDGRDMLLVLISGGASSLTVLPRDGIGVDAYADCVDHLLRAGADIDEINAVRAHIDRLKGGGLARLAGAVPVLGLVLSDVVGDRVEIIASGPLSPRTATAGDAMTVLNRLGLWDACDPAIRSCLQHAAAQPATSEVAGGRDNVRVVVIGNNEVARDGAAAAATRLGYRVVSRAEPVTGEARNAGALLALEALRMQEALEVGAPPVCLVTGGETTVTVRGRGTGGRNQELVLAAAIALRGARGITIGSIGTDGIDGPTDAAGGVADAATLEHVRTLGYDPATSLLDNDSHTLLRAGGATLVTGPTGTNVLDVQVALVHTAGSRVPAAGSR
ncbi:MAG: DUF4147 domain-containing protein [Gemmatimonadota bacterium]